MADIDVSFLLEDPDFCDEFTITRISSSVNGFGETQLTPSNTTLIGVVVAGSGDELIRTPDGRSIKGALSVYSKSRLISGEDGRDADEIHWNGKTYTVVVSSDWGNFGEGFYKAQCALKDLNP